MNLAGWLPLLMIATPLVPGLLIFLLAESSRRTRVLINLTGAVLNVVLTALVFEVVHEGGMVMFTATMIPGLPLKFHADSFSLLFAGLSSILWFLTTVYAIGYLEDSAHQSRFFGFFSLCVATTMGIALAGNLMTLLVFYELLSLTTYPLVVHRGTEAATRAGTIYLTFTLVGGAILLVGVVWLQVLAGDIDFVATGSLAQATTASPGAFRAIFALLIIGFGVKAALVPLHAWLPEAMVAPAPVSALLHAVAVVKAGAFGIVRVVYDIFGIEFCRDLGVLPPLAAAAGITILYGSIRALYQQDLKRRLAFSTISQVSYIVLGVAVYGPLATIGGIVHLVHQGLTKITLFFCAGNFAEALGIHSVGDMAGVGRRMPLTMLAFTLSAFGMIGIPPTAGFVSKWYLGLGGLADGQPWVVAVLVASSLLNAAYFLPLVYAGWFRNAEGPWPHEHAHGGRWEAPLLLLIPVLLTAVLSLAAGIFAGSEFSPLYWAGFIMKKEY